MTESVEMKVSLGNGTIRVRDRDDSVVDVDVCDVGEPPAESPSLGDARIDRTTSVRATRLRLPAALVKTPDGSRYTRDSEASRLHPVRARIDAPVRVHVAANCPATLRRSDDAVVIDLDRRVAVTLGFESRAAGPDERVVVDRTPEGVATALTVLSATVETTSPDRTWPTVRDAPPRIEWGDETRIADSLRERRPETGIVVTLPPHLDYLTTAAPLAYYLGAEVRVESGAEPRVALGTRHEPLGTLPEFAERVAALLRRTFYLDCLARSGGPHGGGLSVSHVIDELGMSVGELYDAQLGERVETYLDLPFDAVAGEFPPWHLTMHVHPTYESVRTLPWAVGDLAQIVPASGTEATVGELAGEPSRLSRGTNNSRRRVRPDEIVPSRWTAWLADGQPLWDFEPSLAGFTNGDHYESVTEPSVALVLADPAMRDETQAAKEAYRGRADDLGIDLDVIDSPTTGQLAQVFESRHSLVHFVGHATDEGLECWGGTLSMDSLDRSRAETFFLNACGSYPHGKRLVEKGSVAGVATDGSVLDDSATAVGVAWSRLVMRGWSVVAAASLAAERATAPASYLTVGDGSHVVTQSDAIVPPTTAVEKTSDGWRVETKHDAVRLAGAVTKGSFDDSFRLFGTTATNVLDDDELHELLDQLESPVIVEEELRWPSERDWI